MKKALIIILIALAGLVAVLFIGPQLMAQEPRTPEWGVTKSFQEILDKEPASRFLARILPILTDEQVAAIEALYQPDARALLERKAAAVIAEYDLEDASAELEMERIRNLPVRQLIQRVGSATATVRGAT